MQKKLLFVTLWNFCSINDAFHRKAAESVITSPEFKNRIWESAVYWAASLWFVSQSIQLLISKLVIQL